MEFDYIIVGAGSAGCVLAEQLSANPRHQVLLVEEGPGEASWLVDMPKGFGKLLADASRTTYLPTVNTRPGGAGQEVWLRGKMLGGSSAINGMVWTRGQPADYDNLADRAGPQWSWSEMLPILRGLENHTMGASETRGSGGPIEVKTHPKPSRLTNAWIAAGKESGLPEKEDQNRLEQEGIGLLQWNIDGRGRRVSSARGFLDRAKGRANLTIATGVRTDRVLVESHRARGIEGVRGGETVRFSARGEVILSAGGLGSPRILQLSGIGPAEQLAAMGVPVILDSPSVGRHLREHILLMQNFRLRHAADSDNSAFKGLRLLKNVGRHLLFGTGPLSFGSSEAAAFVRVLPESKRPDMQIMFQPYSVDPAKGMAFEPEPGMQLYSLKLRPSSEGSVSIASADPAAALVINPNYLAEEEDRRAAVGAIRFIRMLMAQPALRPYIVGETSFTAGARSEDEILAMFREWGQAGYHATATVMMGKDNAAPLDGRLRLRGIEGLRVVDCSVFPEMIAGNTNAPTMALAMRAAQMIQADISA